MGGGVPGPIGKFLVFYVVKDEEMWTPVPPDQRANTEGIEGLL